MLSFDLVFAIISDDFLIGLPTYVEILWLTSVHLDCYYAYTLKSQLKDVASVNTSTVIVLRHVFVKCY